MYKPLSCALFVISGMSAAGIAHSLWLRSPLSRRFDSPVDGGRTLRGRRIFGANKKLRGFVAIVPAAAAAFALLDAALSGLGRGGGPWPLSTGGYALAGAAAALGFMLGELPNSFVKRQLDIPPGAAPRDPVGRVLSLLVDRLDSILGMLAVLTLCVPTGWRVWGLVLLLGPGIHHLFSALLHALGVKSRAG